MRSVISIPLGYNRTEILYRAVAGGLMLRSFERSRESYADDSDDSTLASHYDVCGVSFGRASSLLTLSIARSSVSRSGSVQPLRAPRSRS